MWDHQRRWRHGSRRRCHGISCWWKIRERKAFDSRVSDRKLKWGDVTLHNGSCKSFFCLRGKGIEREFVVAFNVTPSLQYIQRHQLLFHVETLRDGY